MWRKCSPISLLLAFLLLPAMDATAADYAQNAQIAEQIRILSDQQFSAEDELFTRQSKRPALKAQAQAALRNAPALRAKVAGIRYANKIAQGRLNLATAQYIRLVRALGQDPSSPVGDSEQQLVEYLSTSRMQDAALVFQLSSQILNQQAGMLDNLRSSAVGVQQRKRQLDQALAEQRNQQYIANGAQQANESRIAQLTAEIAARQSQLDILQRQLNNGLSWQSLGDSGSLTQGGILTKSQVKFSYQLAALTGLDVNLIKAWTFSEESSDHARGREREHNHNWLNVGYFDKLHGKGAFQGKKFRAAWGDPVAGANTTAAFLEGKVFGASQGIQDILLYSGADVKSQMDAIVTSGWASTGYGGTLMRAYNQVPHTGQPARIHVRWRSPVDGKVYRLGKG